MTELPPDELAALPDELPGEVLELGNKKNSTGLYRDWYVSRGLDYLCVDWNGKDGAVPLDMREEGVWRRLTQSTRLIRYPLVTNFGFTEHVGENILEQLECWRNVHNLVDVGGYLSICMPIMPDWKGHGMWMPTPEWYIEFAALNGYGIELTKIWDRVRRTCVVRLIKNEDMDFAAPPETEFVRIVRSDI